MAWDAMGNFYCCHIDCDNEADFIIKGDEGFEDYTHMCIEHKDEYLRDGDFIKPIIRLVKERMKDALE